MRVSVIIPTLNGKALLQRHLPALIAAEGIGDAELIVVDDGSTDGTAAWLAAAMPQVRVLTQKKNGGFSRACNAGIAAACGDILVLLNNDVEVTPQFLAPLLKPLKNDREVFAVNASILLPGREFLDEGEKRGAFHHGFFYVDCVHDPAERASQTAPTLYATACAAAYRRDMVDALGGFDTLYSPAYWEDVDLSYRALKRGWKVLYAPESVVYHQHEATTARLDPKYLRMVRQRNMFFFVWKNISDLRWTLSSLLLSPWVALYRLARDREASVLRGLLAAALHWPSIAARRVQEKRAMRVSDRALLERNALR